MGSPLALTRARDRLYLSATVQDGAFRPGRGSLGEVLPPTLKELFVQAGMPGAASVIWPGTDRAHTLVIDGHLHNRPLDTLVG